MTPRGWNAWSILSAEALAGFLNRLLAKLTRIWLNCRRYRLTILGGSLWRKDLHWHASTKWNCCSQSERLCRNAGVACGGQRALHTCDIRGGGFRFRRELPTGLVSTADWTRLSTSIDGQPLRLDRGHNLEHRRILDMRQGIFWREWQHQDEAGRITRVRVLRLASLADRHLLLQSATITPENFSGRIFVDATLTGPVVQVTGSGTTVAMAVARRVYEFRPTVGRPQPN